MSETSDSIDPKQPKEFGWPRREDGAHRQLTPAEAVIRRMGIDLIKACMDGDHYSEFARRAERKAAVLRAELTDLIAAEGSLDLSALPIEVQSILMEQGLVVNPVDVADDSGEFAAQSVEEA